MRKSKHFPMRAATLAVMLALGAAAGPAATLAGEEVTSTREAYLQGRAAYQNRNYAMAIWPLDIAAGKNHFFAQYYLASIYADPSSGYSNPGKAYDLYYKLVENNLSEIDPGADSRAPFFAKALTALARYRKNGIAAAGVLPNPEEAAFYLREAANTYGYKDAQFELAKLLVSGRGVRKNVDLGASTLWTLVRKQHAGAQAFLADLLWRGKVDLPWRGKKIRQDEKRALVRKRALALITAAVANAPDHERIWIEDIYHSIFCGMSKGTREQSTGYVAGFLGQFARPLRDPDPGSPERVCSDGERVTPVDRRSAIEVPRPRIAKRR